MWVAEHIGGEGSPRFHLATPSAEVVAIDPEICSFLGDHRVAGAPLLARTGRMMRPSRVDGAVLDATGRALIRLRGH